MNPIRTLTLLPFLLFAATFLAGCASSHNPADPLEPINRGIYKFNDTFDKAVAKPVAKGYNYVMPDPGKTAVRNFFSNLDDVWVTFNDLLQLKFAQAASDGSRFVINSTFGIFGLFNVASRLEKHHEDFGQTLGYWRVGSGPYLVLPFLGPSDVRDAAGLYVDSTGGVYPRIDNVPSRNELYLTEKVEQRATLLESEGVLDTAATDKYSFIRDAYLQHRQSLVYDGNPPRPKYDEEDDGSDAPPPAPAAPAPSQAAPEAQPATGSPDAAPTQQ